MKTEPTTIENPEAVLKGKTSKEAELEQLREARAKRESEAREQLEALELEELRLEDKFSQTHGTRGQDFEIVKTPMGCIVLERGPAVLYKTLRSSKYTDPDLHDFVNKQVVHPDKKAASAIFDRFPGVKIPQCVDAAAKLHMGKVSEEAGK